uniref:Integrase catalytic domain-containing protein n=1 Tax=Cannabis sativa TaxID=3483 RepID=A0A803Q8A0_CANSA
MVDLGELILQSNEQAVNVEPNVQSMDVETEKFELDEDYVTEEIDDLLVELIEDENQNLVNDGNDSAFIQFKALAENQFDTKIKQLRSDWGGEYQAFANLVNECGIDFNHPCPHTSAQNGRTKRKHRHIVEMGLTLFAQANMPLKYWVDAFQTSAYVINRLPTPVLNGKSPCEVLYSKKPDYKFLKNLCFQPQSEENIPDVPQNTELPTGISTPQATAASSPGKEHDSSHTSQVDLTGHLFVDLNIDPANTTILDSQEEQFSSQQLYADQNQETTIEQSHNGGEPISVAEALKHKGRTRAMSDENVALIKNKTWILVPHSPEYNVVGNNDDGSLQRLKGRLVAKGFRQRPGLDFGETLNPYLVHTRLDIAYAVNKLSQFLKCPTTTHYNAAKRILRYLKGTQHHGLHIQHSNNLNITGYSDADWACCPDDRKALAHVTAEIIWIESLLNEIKFPLPTSSVVWCDNMTSSALATNPVYHARTKHVEFDLHFVRDRVLQKKLNIQYVPSSDQIADCFTKGLSHSRFQFLIDKLGVTLSPSRLRGGVKKLVNQ